MSATAMVDSDVYADMMPPSLPAAAYETSPTGATSGATTLESGEVAHLNVRIQCDLLGHGEEVFLVVGGPPLTPTEALTSPHQTPDSTAATTGKTLELFTTPSQFPWYQTVYPIAITLPSLWPNAAAAATHAGFTYRYAIHRAGVFHRWEDLEFVSTDSNSKNAAKNYRTIPLRLLQRGEVYTVNDTLDVAAEAPDLDHIPARAPSGPPFQLADSLHNRANSSDGTKAVSSSKKSSTTSPAPVRKKAIAFMPPNTVTTSGDGSTTPNTFAPPVKQSVQLSSTDGLVVVSVFLPVILHRSAMGQWSADWDYEMLLSMETHLRVVRIGVVKWHGWTQDSAGISKTDGALAAAALQDTGIPKAERHLVEECLRHLRCVPVWVDPTLFSEMYNGFCKGVLWPVLHNVTSVYSHRPDDNIIFSSKGGSGADSGGGTRAGSNRNDPEQFSDYSMDDVEQGPIHGGRGREAELWGAYNTVNRRFAEVVVQCFNEGDLVWIHGFHLLILPSYLTRRIPMAKVGIFLHTPFPSSEIFRTLWCREDLLRGMLNADQVGFHLFEYARHFLTSCRRLLGLNYGMIPDSSGGHTLAIDTNGRHVAVTAIHAGIEPPVLGQILSHSSTLQNAASIRRSVEGKHICCAIDRLESLKGVPLKLLGLERFLKRCPEWVGKIVLIQVGISAFERGDDYTRTKEEVTRLVEQINGQWPGSVQFQECSETAMGLQQRMALLRAADTVVVTAIRDGLNLLPLEYTFAHQDAMTEVGKKDGRKRGLCILSEFSSSTRVMRGALHINPWKISEIANAFHKAVNIGEDERLRRIGIASEFVTRVTTQRWALAVMLDLKGVHKNINPVQYSGAGLGLGYRLLGMNTGFTSLDINALAKAYRNAKARLILVDYGGTIVSNDNLDNLTRFQMVRKRSAPSVPTERMISVLKGLCADARNTVFVVSGKERHSLTNSLQGIPNLGLAAEHGMFISWPTKHTDTKRRWETLVPETDRSWRSLAISIMEVYTSRTHGSYIEETEMKVLWQYRDADTEFGSLQAKELEDHLSKYLRSFPVDILHGGIEEGGYVEVRPKGVNKGVLAMRVVKRFPEIAQKDKVDFALVLGDDHCDEPMLSVMRQIGRRVMDASLAAQRQDPLPPMPATIQLVDVSPCDNYVSPDLEVFTCTIGKKPSAAANYLHDVDEVQELLDSLVKLSTREQRFYSSVDLRSISNEYTAANMPFDGVMPDGTENAYDLPKSMSSIQFSKHQSLSSSEISVPVPSTLNQYLGTIKDDADDEMFF